ncbi:hypothetical protein CEY15_17220 [Dietzia natronolimnaea]|uniref:Sulfotransferase domain-containing protein n=1 Tax=Dietzia natronolimnaea TaxID=161920 RepID=A0A2A2WKN0_9ACTN|nr:sulfotransferase [Dietzia natronolimnaea]PAY21758.1 hypothetical protein CEY15_17220 [Dietzia natronolimnaea]
MRPRNPDFIIAGAQKSATTFAAEYLNGSTGVLVQPGEIPWLESPYFEAGGASRVRYKLANAPADQVIGFKRANYFTTCGIANRISREFPDSDVIVILRDPIGRAFSATLHYIEYGHLPFGNPNQLLEELLDGKHVDARRAWEVLNWGRYREHIEFMVESVKPERLHFMNQKDVITDPKRALEKVPSFAAVQLASTVPPKVNSGASDSVDLWLRRRMRLALTSRDQLTGAVYADRSSMAKLALGTGWRFCASLNDRVSARTRPSFVLEPSVRERLNDYYAEDVKYVRKMLGIDLTS